MILDIIRTVIINWDPIQLMEFAPTDEYDDECKKIFDEYTTNKKTLETIIYEVFVNSFGEELPKDDVRKVALNIENMIQNQIGEPGVKSVF